MSSRHVVRRGGDIDLAAPAGSNATGLRRWSIVDEDTPGAVHTGFAIVELAAGGLIPWHVHSYEDSLYVLEGEVVVDTGEGANLLRVGDYGVSFLAAAPGSGSGNAARSSATTSSRTVISIFAPASLLTWRTNSGSRLRASLIDNFMNRIVQGLQ